MSNMAIFRHGAYGVILQPRYPSQKGKAGSISIRRNMAARHIQGKLVQMPTWQGVRSLFCWPPLKRQTNAVYCVGSPFNLPEVVDPFKDPFETSGLPVLSEPNHRCVCKFFRETFVWVVWGAPCHAAPSGVRSPNAQKQKEVLEKVKASNASATQDAGRM